MAENETVTFLRHVAELQAFRDDRDSLNTAATVLEAIQSGALREHAKGAGYLGRFVDRAVAEAREWERDMQDARSRRASVSA